MSNVLIKASSLASVIGDVMPKPLPTNPPCVKSNFGTIPLQGESVSLVDFVLESFRNNISPSVKIETLEQSTEFYIIDVRKGGLVLGRSHDQGGIWFITLTDENNVTFAELEGYEYIVNATSTIDNMDIIETVNKYNELEFKEYTPPESITVIDVTEFEQYNKQVLLVLSDNQFIVNKHATKKHLIQIEQLNSCQ